MLAKMLEKSRIILMHRIMDGCFSKLSCFLVCTPIIRLFGAWERCARMVSPSCHPYRGREGGVHSSGFFSWVFTQDFWKILGISGRNFRKIRKYEVFWSKITRIYKNSMKFLGIFKSRKKTLQHSACAATATKTPSLHTVFFLLLKIPKNFIEFL